MAGQQTNEWKLGLFVVTSIMVGLASILWLGANRFEREIISAWTYFDESVQGLEAGSAVKFRGVLIGNVSQIRVAPDHRRVAVLMHINADVLSALGLRREGQRDDPGGPFVPPDVRVQLASSGLTGGKYLSIDKFDPTKTKLPELPFPVPWNYVPATPSTLKSVEETVLKLAVDVPQAIADARELFHDARRFLVEIDPKGLTHEAQALMSETRQTVAAVDGPALAAKVDGLLTALDRTANRVDALAADLGRLTGEEGELTALVADAREVTRTVNDAIERADLAATTASLRDTSGSVGGLTRDLGAMSRDLRQALTSLRDAADKVARLAEVLERDPGSLIHGRSPGAAGPGGRR